MSLQPTKNFKNNFRVLVLFRNEIRKGKKMCWFTTQKQMFDLDLVPLKESQNNNDHTKKTMLEHCLISSFSKFRKHGFHWILTFLGVSFNIFLHFCGYVYLKTHIAAAKCLTGELAVRWFVKVFFSFNYLDLAIDVFYRILIIKQRKYLI